MGQDNVFVYELNNVECEHGVGRGHSCDECARDRGHKLLKESKKMEQDNSMLNDIPTELELHEILERFFANHKHTGKAYDEQGKSGFIVVCFNKYHDPDRLPADATPTDKMVAMGASTYMSLPEVEESEEGTIGPRETAGHGIQAVATAMMGTTMQHTILHAIFQEAQRFMIERRAATHD